jgi:hypothetical protein
LSSKLDRFLAPFRSEEAAFRVLLYVLAVCVALIVVVTIIRAIT